MTVRYNDFPIIFITVLRKVLLAVQKTIYVSSNRFQSLTKRRRQRYPCLPCCNKRQHEKVVNKLNILSRFFLIDTAFTVLAQQFLFQSLLTFFQPLRRLGKFPN